jgi:hypothetical protein
MTAVVDASILISAYTEEEILSKLWKRGLPGVALVVSPEVVIETERALRGLDFHLTSGEIRAMLLDILDRVQVERLKEAVGSRPGQHLAQLARQTKAEYIVSEDVELEKSVRGPKVVTLKIFCDEVLDLPRLASA